MGDGSKKLPGAGPGLRSIAVFEAAKGALIVAAGFGILSVLHKDVQQVAEELVRHMHLNPARHYPQIFIIAAGRLGDANLRLMAGGAFLYSTVRFIEAYGLWNSLVWAQWFAILTGLVYVPFEAIELARRVTPLRAALLTANLLIVLYIFRVRYKERSRS